MELNISSKLILMTRGRVDMKRQETLKNLPKFITKKIIVVCPPQEVGPLKQLLMILDIPVLGIVGIPHKNCSDLRHKVINYIKGNLIFLDDNMNFHCREYSDKGLENKYLLKGMNNKYFSKEKLYQYFLEMFIWVDNKIISGNFGMVGLSSRSGNNFLKSEEVYNSRTCAFWGINYKNYLKSGSPRVDKISSKQDFLLELSFLKSGIPCVLTSNYAYDKCGGSNSKGGCSIYRNIDRMNKDAYALKSLFPDEVSIIEKDSNKWGNLDKDKKFYDVKISWKKAYKGIPIEEITGYKPAPPRTKENYKNKI